MRRRLPALAPGTVAFFALLVVTLVVAVLVVRARTPDLALEVTRIANRELVVGDDDKPARITFFVREDDPAAAVEIVDSDGQVARTLAEPVELESDRPVTYAWDGLTDTLRPAFTGRYRLRVRLPGSDRDMVWPRRIIVTRAPETSG